MRTTSAVLLAAVTLAALSACCFANRDFNIVNDIYNERPQSVQLRVLGPMQEQFNRSSPNVMDPSLMEDFAHEFSFMQDISVDPEDPNVFEQTSVPYVAAISNAYVEGESGLVWDRQGNIFHEKNMFFERTSPNPMPTEVTSSGIFDKTTKLHYPLLATTIQRYGHMYYHFVVETLPKLVLLKEAGLPKGTKILMWGEPYEQKFLDMLDIPKEDVVKYDPLKVYTSDVLFFPTPVPRITPARESLEMTREALGVEVLPEEERDLVIYCSRNNTGTREVENEHELLMSLKEAFPNEKIVTYDQVDDVTELIHLFQRAKVILGPHGAGLSHMLFAAPGTRVIEFQFMRDPPMMFWHVAAALNQDYWLLPVPNAWWMQKKMNVPVVEVVDIMTAILTDSVSSRACKPGSFLDAHGNCVQCAEGTYSFTHDSPACAPCFEGRYADKAGSSYCRTCPADSYSKDGKTCERCPDNKISWIPGAHNETQCLSFKEHAALLRDISLNLQMLHKLSPKSRVVSRRTLVETTTYGLVPPSEVVVEEEVSEPEEEVVEVVEEPEEPEVPAEEPITAFAGPSEQDIIEACRMMESFDDPYMSPPVLQDIDCSQVDAFAKEEVMEQKPHKRTDFKHDKECITGFAIKGTRDSDRKGHKEHCVACDLPMLLDITQCNALDASEKCCQAAMAWNNGGCQCAPSSHELAREMGASHSLMKALSHQCGFEMISEARDNCPATIHNSAHLQSAAYVPWSTFIPATVGAALLLIFALITE